MLGPSAILLGTPAAWILSLRAWHTATDRPFAGTALAITALETIALVVTMLSALWTG